MDTKEQILELFDSIKIKEILSELMEAGEELSSREPTLGFHHKFYIPGWISIIQISIVESKMSKFEKQPFYKEKDFVDFVNWIIESSKQLASLQVENKDMAPDSYKYKLQCNAIIGVLQGVTESWFNCAPEVASMCNREYSENMKISLAGIIYRAFEQTLKPIGYPESSDKEPKYNGPSFSDMGNQLLAMICNIILFAIIIGICSLIFR